MSLFADCDAQRAAVTEAFGVLVAEKDKLAAVHAEIEKSPELLAEHERACPASECLRCAQLGDLFGEG